MARINDKNAQLNRWLARIFPPSSPQYAQPSELDEVLKLEMPALPPSLLYERAGHQVGTTVNPATELFFPSTTGLESFGAAQAGVPFGKFYWIIAARWSQVTANVSSTGRAFIALKNTASAFELSFATGWFRSGDASFGTNFLDTRAPQVSDLAGTISVGGGGLSPFAVPPGYCVHFSTAATPAATTTFFGVIHYVVCDIGELVP